MIKQNINYGNIIIPTLAEFGTGDIAVMHGSATDYVIVLFKNTPPFEIGSESTFKKGESSENVKPELAMVFDNENSLNVVIKQLEEAREALHEILINPAKA